MFHFHVSKIIASEAKEDRKLMDQLEKGNKLALPSELIALSSDPRGTQSGQVYEKKDLVLKSFTFYLAREAAGGKRGKSGGGGGAQGSGGGALGDGGDGGEKDGDGDRALRIWPKNQQPTTAQPGKAKDNYSYYLMHGEKAVFFYCNAEYFRKGDDGEFQPVLDAAGNAMDFMIKSHLVDGSRLEFVYRFGDMDEWKTATHGNFRIKFSLYYNHWTE